MQLISLTVLTRRGVAVNQVQAIDIDDICSPIILDGTGSKFSINESAEAQTASVFSNSAAVVEYTSAEDPSAIALLAGSIFVATVLSVKGRPPVGNSLIGFNAKFLGEMILVLETDEVKLQLSTPSRAGILVPTDQDADENLLMLVMPVMMGN